MERDQEVNAFYQTNGWIELRFWDFEVKGDLLFCLSEIKKRSETKLDNICLNDSN